MAVITINGPIGSGPIEIGQLVSQRLDLSYVDRMVFAEAAKLVGTPVKTLIDKEQRSVRFGDRLVQLLQTVGSGDHDYGFGIDTLPETYAELANNLGSTAQKVNDKTFIEATTTVVTGLARSGNVVIIGRGANRILSDHPGVLHVGITAPTEVCIETLQRREHFDRDEAKTYVENLEKARISFFRKFFKVHPDDVTSYHMVLNLGEMGTETAAEIIVHAASQLAT